MHRNVVFSTFAISAIYLWFRELNWVNNWLDTLPILFAFPVVFFFGRPWQIDFQRGLSTRAIGLGVACLIGGVALNSLFLLAASWVCHLYGWLEPKLCRDQKVAQLRLLPILLLAFPWLAVEGDSLGWYFRISGAWANEILFSFLGLEVSREGTRLLVQGWPIEVEPACSGLRSLQVMLLAGCIIAFDAFRYRRFYWIHLPVVILISWVGNSLRIACIVALAITYSPEMAEGLFHDLGGILVVGIMVLLCEFVMRRLGSWLPKQEVSPC